MQCHRALVSSDLDLFLRSAFLEFGFSASPMPCPVSCPGYQKTPCRFRRGLSQTRYLFGGARIVRCAAGRPLRMSDGMTP
jgi:hypothetical protein